MQNPYVPYPVVVDKIITEVDTKDIKTFRFKFVNPEDEKKYAYIPGQFGELSIFGKGESPIGIASSPTQKGYVEFTVQKAGVVTSALHEMEEGTLMGSAAPWATPGRWNFWRERTLLSSAADLLLLHCAL